MTREACKGWFTEETPSLILTTMSEWLSQRTADPRLTPSHSDSGWSGRELKGAWRPRPGEWPAQPRASPSWARKSQDGWEQAKGTVTRRLEWGQETCPLALARPWMGGILPSPWPGSQAPGDNLSLNFLHLMCVSLHGAQVLRYSQKENMFFLTEVWDLTH